MTNRIYIIDNNVKYVEYIDSEKVLNIVYNSNEREYLFQDEEDSKEGQNRIKPIFEIIEKALKKDVKTIVVEENVN